jgi:hypothetical protein
MIRLFHCIQTILLFTAASTVNASIFETDTEEFARLINEYRVENGKASVPVTVSLTEVAQLHAFDLFTYEPHLSGSGCNTHSWSANGPWTPMCYTPDHTEAANMWNKPSEITNNVYTGNGYELAAFGYSTSSDALEGFKNSSPHNDVLLNVGIWAGFDPWPAMGVGIEDSYYTVWFGDITDPQGDLSSVPVPAAVWLFGSALIGLIGFGKRRKTI